MGAAGVGWHTETEHQNNKKQQEMSTQTNYERIEQEWSNMGEWLEFKSNQPPGATARMSSWLEENGHISRALVESMGGRYVAPALPPTVDVEVLQLQADVLASLMNESVNIEDPPRFNEITVPMDTTVGALAAIEEEVPRREPYGMVFQPFVTGDVPPLDSQQILRCIATTAEENNASLNDVGYITERL